MGGRTDGRMSARVALDVPLSSCGLLPGALESPVQSAIAKNTYLSLVRPSRWHIKHPLTLIGRFSSLTDIFR